MERKVDLRALKRFTRSELPGYPILRNLILSEADEVPADEFVGMVRVWLRVFNLETQMNSTAGETQVFLVHSVRSAGLVFSPVRPEHEKQNAGRDSNELLEK